MRHLKLTVAYHGGAYVGWQVQPNGMSVQQVLEEAWQAVTAEQVRLTASGRTDAGVHALGQVCSVATQSSLDAATLQRALNANSPRDVCVLRVDEAAEGFHAIRDALAKTYRYLVQVGPCPSVFHRDRCWFVSRELDIGAMREAAGKLLGRHDFASFEAAGSPRGTTVRTITRLDIAERICDGYGFVQLEIRADGFLYNMVRNITGTLVDVGRGQRDAGAMASILSAERRQAAGPTAPPQGLFLESVEYPADHLA